MKIPPVLPMTMPERAAGCLRDPDQTLMPAAVALAVAAWFDTVTPGDAVAEHAAAVVVDAYHEATYLPPK